MQRKNERKKQKKKKIRRIAVTIPANKGDGWVSAITIRSYSIGKLVEFMFFVLWLNVLPTFAHIVDHRFFYIYLCGNLFRLLFWNRAVEMVISKPKPKYILFWFIITPTFSHLFTKLNFDRENRKRRYLENCTFANTTFPRCNECNARIRIYSEKKIRETFPEAPIKESGTAQPIHLCTCVSMSKYERVEWILLP